MTIGGSHLFFSGTAKHREGMRLWAPAVAIWDPLRKPADNLRRTLLIVHQPLYNDLPVGATSSDVCYSEPLAKRLHPLPAYAQQPGQSKCHLCKPNCKQPAMRWIQIQQYLSDTFAHLSPGPQTWVLYPGKNLCPPQSFVIITSCELIAPVNRSSERLVPEHLRGEW